MTVPVHDVEAELLRRIAAADAVFLFLDYDGTLAPIAPTPAEAAPLPGTAELLRALAALPQVRVAVVSGRPITELREHLDVPGLYYVGVHGLEVRLPNGDTHAAEGTAGIRSILPVIKRRLLETLRDRPGILLEDKGAALACHYRLASPADAAAAEQATLGLVREYRSRGALVTLMRGHAVAEIRPAHVNKGKTVCALLAQHGPAALPVYIGDDRTDEDAFQLLPAHAISIRVGDGTERTYARYRVATPEDVQRFLRAVKVTRSEPRRPHGRAGAAGAP